MTKLPKPTCVFQNWHELSVTLHINKDLLPFSLLAHRCTVDI